MQTQTEVIDERQAQILKSLESDERKRQILESLESNIGNIGLLWLGTKPSTSSSGRHFQLPRGHLDNVQTILTINYDEIIARALSQYEVPIAPPATSPIPFRNRELEWRRTHAENLKSLQNQWVVLEGEEIVSHGSNAIEVVAEARSKGIRTPYVFYVESFADDVSKMGL